ncbi:DUF998 domain-containing protein [Lysobacter sp. HDW10]|uniref:DUF998 domain-containing protein n=1 Tax=Lysobacter sp. HDW10 TaxID=2714936 RepID=UPI00140B0F88|nr:DUF998 domain-containing protein [Lysobacter sp. HDW10]QIK80637.1 DUF998 domain-containing protein [Lysobacter sp. HDW10]
MTQPVQRRIKLARLLAIATISFGVLFYTIGAAVKPGYSHFTHFISELNATGTPWAVQLGLAGFVPLGLLFAAFLVAVAPIAQVRGTSRLGLWLLWSQPIAFIGAAIAPCDAGCPTGGSPIQMAHDVLGLATYLPCTLALVLLSFAPNLLSGWRLFLRFAGVAWLILFVAMLQPEVMHVRGLLQRVADALLAAAVLIIAWRMVDNALATPNNSFKARPLRGAA